MFNFDFFIIKFRDNFQEMFKFLQENLKNVLFKLQNAKISRPDISTKGKLF